MLGSLCLVCEARPAVAVHHDYSRGWSFCRIRDGYLLFNGLTEDSPELATWFGDIDHQAQWIAFHQARFCGVPVCLECHYELEGWRR